MVVFFQDSSNSVSKIRTSLLNLVDLAGSERQRDTQSVGMRLKVTLHHNGCFHKASSDIRCCFSTRLFSNLLIVFVLSVDGRKQAASIAPFPLSAM